MKNLKRIRALAPLFPRYRILKMYTKRDWNEKWSFLENSRVFRWKFFKVSRIARATCSGLRVRSYLINTTSTRCSSAHRTLRILHFISDIVIHQKKNGWWKGMMTHYRLSYFSFSSLAYHHVLLINMACSYSLFHVSLVAFPPVLSFMSNLCHEVVFLFIRLYTIYKWRASKQLISVFLASISKWSIQQMSWRFSLIEHRTYCLPPCRTPRPPPLLSQIANVK